MKKHTSGTSRSHGESVGPGPVKGAGEVRMAGTNPTAKRVTMRPAGGNFQGGANSYSPKKMSIQRQGE